MYKYIFRHIHIFITVICRVIWSDKLRDPRILKLKVRLAHPSDPDSKASAEMRETQVRSLGREDPLEKERATHSSILAWKTPWTEGPGRLQSMGLKRVGHNWATSPHSLWSQDACRVNLHLVQTGGRSQTQQGLQAPDLCILHQLLPPRFHGKETGCWD